MKNLFYPLILVITLFFVAPITLAKDTIGLFMSFQINDDETYQEWRSKTSHIFKTHQCKPFRHGKIMAAKGSLQWGTADYFSIVACQSSLLSELEIKGHINSLKSIVNNLSIVEGDLLQSPHKKLTTSVEYIIKISYFNNLNILSRNKALKDIERQASLINDAWIGDAILKPTASLGLITPDELTFLYYPKAGQGVIFRENNPVIMKEIGMFNHNHVERFTYLESQLKTIQNSH